MRSVSYPVAIIVRLRCQAVAREWLADGTIRCKQTAAELGERYARKQIDAVEHDAKILIAWGMPHAGM